MKYDTIKEAAQAWVKEFNAIPMGIVEKLTNVLGGVDDTLYEVTPPSQYDRVHVCGGEHASEEGEIIQTGYDDDSDLYLVRLDQGEEVVVEKSDLEVERESYLPMWGTMWAFGEQLDNDWLDGKYCENGLQAMADCGFRIYEQEDYGYIFGIDGAGYDFYEAHWIPLYKARGLHWHKEESDVVGTL